MESNTIAPGDRFTDVVNDDLLRKVDGAKLTGILCFGPVNENEMLFCAEDGRYYFSFRNGWGVKDNTLYGLDLGLAFDYKHSTEVKNIAEECRRHYGSYSTWAGAVAAHHRRAILDTITSVVSNSCVGLDTV